MSGLREVSYNPKKLGCRLAGFRVEGPGCKGVGVEPLDPNPKTLAVDF